MGQQCSCLPPKSRKRHRTSDASIDSLEAYSTDSVDSIDIQIDVQDDELKLESQSLLLETMNKELHTSMQFIEKNAEKIIALPRTDDGYNNVHRNSQIDSLHDNEERERRLQANNTELLRLYRNVTGLVIERQSELECVMCLDNFTNENPKVRTLCNCGMNRTNFHMSCLIEWKKRNATCPVCRTYLFYED